VRASSAAKLEMVEKLVAQYQHQAKTDQVPQRLVQKIWMKARGGGILRQVVERRDAVVLVNRDVVGKVAPPCDSNRFTPALADKSENNTAWPLQPGS